MGIAAAAAGAEKGGVSRRRNISGWVILDKPLGLTSTQALAQVKRLFHAKKGGHVGTLDPLATGVLPIALGEATKTISSVEDGEKKYSFSLEWGSETDTGDTEGVVTGRSDRRPSFAQICAAIPQFIGPITQRPPIYSAIKINGARAYDLARDGRIAAIEPRIVHVRELRILDSQDKSASFEVACGKGTYVRSIARDLGRALGTLAHVTALRRTGVGIFDISAAKTLSGLAAAPGNGLLPIETSLTRLKRIEIDSVSADILRMGRAISGGQTESHGKEPAYAMQDGTLIAIGVIRDGIFAPSRIFNHAA